MTLSWVVVTSTRFQQRFAPAAMNGGDTHTDTMSVTDNSPVGDTVFFSLKNAPDFMSLIPLSRAHRSIRRLWLQHRMTGTRGATPFFVMATDAMNLRWVQEVTTSVFNTTGTTHFMAVDGVEFIPSSLTIAAGDTVTWNWVSGVCSLEAADGSFAATINPDIQQFSHTFTTPGTYNHTCLEHEDVGMLGTIIVQ